MSTWHQVVLEASWEIEGTWSNCPCRKSASPFSFLLYRHLSPKVTTWWTSIWPRRNWRTWRWGDRCWKLIGNLSMQETSFSPGYLLASRCFCFLRFALLCVSVNFPFSVHLGARWLEQWPFRRASLSSLAILWWDRPEVCAEQPEAKWHDAEKYFHFLLNE